MDSEPHPSGVVPVAPALPRTTLLGVGVLSTSLLLLEIALTRYFSFRLWYHYAFMIISIAMLGLSASSGVLAVARSRMRGMATAPIMTFGACLSAATVLVALPIMAKLNAVWANHPQATAAQTFGLLALYWLVLFIPFFCGGCAISCAIDRFTSRISVLYGWDLAGGALGCVLAVLLLSTRSPEQTLTFAATLALVASSLFLRAEIPRGRGRSAFMVAMAALLLVSFFQSIGIGADDAGDAAAITPTKGLAQDLRSGGKLVASLPSMLGRVDVVDTGRASAWGLGPAYRGLMPRQLMMRIDGDALTTITRWDKQPDTWRFAEFMPATLPYVVGHPGKILIIGAGGGMDVINAIEHGARDVVGVEINDGVLDMVRGPFAEFSGGIYRDPRVHMVHGDGRNYVERSTQHFDLIQMTLVDTFAAISSGALSLAEDFLYTTEAFRAYVRALAPDGYLVLGRTRHEGLSLTILLDRATRELGLDLQRHIFIAANPVLTHGLVVLFKRSPLTIDEVTRGVVFAKNAGLQLVYAPGHETGADGAILEFLRRSDRDQFIASRADDIVPETDDKPFYFRGSKWTALLGTYVGGRGNLLVILAVSVFFAIVCILVPLGVMAPTAMRERRSLLALFGCIGLGYILLELGLMVHFTLFLGHPVRSLTVILFALLLSSGLGSYVSRRLSGGASSGRFFVLALPFLAVIALALAYGFLLKPLLASAMGLGLPVRMAIAVGLISALGFSMGMPLPMAMVRLGAERRELVLWAWGINGTCSVIGSTACILIAHVLGYRSVVLIGALCYMAALVCFRLSSRGRG
jgi:SAM-dependent methyltransferase